MTIRILVGDVRSRLAEIPDGAVRCCVTSPPYFGLRDYGQAGQIGLESTPETYAAELVSVFREARRVLTDDGTLWLNLGDSYTASGSRVPVGLKTKDLIGIPWRVAFALQADGWYLRSDIIWHKPNPIPESVTDRPTKSHEYLFLLSKSERYYYDADAIAEAATCPDVRMVDGFVPKSINGKHAGDPQSAEFRRATRESGGAYAPPGQSAHGNARKQDAVGKRTYSGFNDQRSLNPTKTRNKRTVWTVPTSPFKGAHFATFPTALIEPCILAGSAKGDTVLDPFGGAGTTGLVANRRGRSAILCELNPEYTAMAEQRIRNDSPLFSDVTLDFGSSCA